MIQKPDIPNPYEGKKSISLPEEETATIDHATSSEEGLDTRESKLRRAGEDHLQLTWSTYERLAEKLKASNPDLSKTRDGRIECAYYEMNNRAYRVSSGGKKKDCIRRLGEHTKLNVVYLPPEIRTEGMTFEGDTLYLAQDELRAWELSRRGLLCVGLPRPDAFLTRPTQHSPHKLIKQVMREHDLAKVVYLADPDFLRLPKGDPAQNPYEYVNAATHAEKALAICASLEKAFPETPVSMLLPPEQPGPDNFENWTRLPISSGTNHVWKQAFHIDSAEKFYQYHGGPTALGYIFTFGKNVYEYDPRTGMIDLAGNANDCFTVSESQGRYWAQVKNAGDVAISNFVMKFELEVKQENSFFLVEFAPMRGHKQMSTISVSDLISADTFKGRVMDIPGAKFSFWGSKPHLEQLVAMLRDGTPEAISLENHLGYYAPDEVWVYGNGLLKSDGDFVDADERGVAQVGEQQYYLPGFASFNETKASLYRDERQYEFVSSGVELKEWMNLFIEVHGMPGHVALTYLFSSLYLDLFRSEGFEVFPHLSIFAPVGSGKSSIANSLSRFFGNLTQTNLRAGVTRASFDRKIELFHNSVIILNEFNLSNTFVQKQRLEEYLVGVYDNQAREKTVNNRSKQARPNSSIITIGQESFWHREALATRCIIQELEAKETRTAIETRKFNELEELVTEGISEFNKLFFENRPLIKQKLRQTVKETQTALKSLQKGRAAARLVLNWAMAISPLLILVDEKLIDYPLTRTQIIGYAADQVAIQGRRLISEGVLSIFFGFIAAEYGPRKLLSHQDAWIYRKENKLRLRLGTLHKHFRTFVHREGYGIENTSKEDLEGRLKGHPAFIRITKGVQIGYRTREGGYIATDGSGNPIPNTPGCKIIELDYAKITDFDLPDVLWNEQEEVEKSPF